MNRLTIEIEAEQHRQIKTLATFAGMTIKEFILSKTLTPSSAQPQQSEDTTARLLSSPKNAKRLRELAKNHPEVKMRILVGLEPGKRLTPDGIWILHAEEFTKMLWKGEIFS
jgi:hypothetical protein